MNRKTRSVLMKRKDPSLQFPHGAEWVRVDCHLHTDADGKFKYEGDPDYYQSNYSDALESAGIRLGIVTNHNKFDLAEFKSLRSAANKKGIELLAGVELSVNDGKNGIHTLVVFSDAWLANGQNHINPFLTAVFEGKSPDEYERENGRCSCSLMETIKKLEAFNRDFFLIFAHVEQKSGLWKELDGGRLSDLGKQPLYRERTLGFQKVRTHDGAGSGKVCRTKVQDWLKDWYPAELEGSDPVNISEIGKGQPCYVKLGELSFSALKFALSEPVGRVVAEIPKRSSSYIQSLSFEGGILNGKTIRFSPELNTLIGIRGSGKSSILEAIRYVLDFPAGKEDTKYKEDLIPHTLGSGGKVSLVARDSYGQEFTVSRIFREAPNVYLDGQLQPGISIRETVLRRPIYFGQKDLSSSGEGFEKDLVEKLVGEQLRPLRSKIESQRQRVREAVDRYLKLQNTAEQKREYQDQLADAKFRLKKFEEFGVAKKLEKRLGFQQDAATIKRIRGQVEAFIHDLEDLLARHEDDLRNATSYQSKQNAEFFKEFFGEYAQILEQLNRAKAMAEEGWAILERLDKQLEKFDGNLQTLKDEFAEIERRLAEELKQSGTVSIQPDEFLQEQKRKEKAKRMLEALEKQETQKVSIRDALLTELDNLNQLWLEEFNLIKKELEKVNLNHTALRITSDFKGDKESAISFMQQIFKGSNMRETTLRATLDDYADFGALFRDYKKAREKAGSHPEVFDRIFRDNLGDFLTLQVPNRFEILFHNKELKHHSLGQRASALILYVLSQRENDVIIIDQPEDDLDNQTIYDDVIKLIRKMKPSIQFIFATHNANFPVLGDAEQVHACTYQDESLETRSGSLDATPIRKAIIDIMEGGEEAFNKRKEVYNLWKPPNSSN